MGSRRKYGRNHNCKGSIRRYKLNLYQGNNWFKRSFHDKFCIESMSKNTKVQGRPPLLQCITFHSLLAFEEIVVLRIYLVKHQKSMTRITFEFTRIRESIGSTQRDNFTKLYNHQPKQGVRVRKQSIEVKTDDTIYRRYWVPREELTSCLNMKDTIGY
jgi:hypothetical protein